MLVSRVLILVVPAIMLGCAGGSPPIQIIPNDVLYVANAGDNSISAFQILQADGNLRPVSGSPFGLSSPPTSLASSLAIEGTLATLLFVASESAQTISSFRIENDTGILQGPLFTVNTGTTPKSLAVFRNGLFVANFEGSVSGFLYDGEGRLTPVPGSPFPAGAGPVSISSAEPGFVYVANSLSDDVSVFSINRADGSLSQVPGSPFLAGDGPTDLEVAVEARPTFLYVANGNSNDISAYTFEANGALSEVPGSPFSAAVAPVSLAATQFLPIRFFFAANTASNDVSAYRIEENSGNLSPLGGSPLAAGAEPASIAVDPRAQGIYVANLGSSDLTAYQLDPNTGAVARLAGSPFRTGSSPRAALAVSTLK
ncbi:MAG: lactonase family protein [Acidobacteria bacterium]|nr:lactonase family protein [Acidobacteriota bacterium]